MPVIMRTMPMTRLELSARTRHQEVALDNDRISLRAKRLGDGA
jgi:hypothetical protein